MAFDLLVRAFFSDAGLSAGLQKANAGLNQLAKSGPGARSGLRAVEIGARQLAFQAAGLSGGLGNLSRGLLMFSGGSALMLGVVAGVGAVAFAYNALTKESREASKAQQELHESLIRTARARAEGLLPGSVRIGRDIATARAELADLNRQRSARVAALGDVFLARGFNTLDEAIAADSQLAKIDEQRAALSLTLAQNRAAETDALKQQNAEQEKLAKKERERIAALVHLSTFARVTPPTETGAGPGVSNQLVEAAMRGGPSLAMRGVGGETAPGAFRAELKGFSVELAAQIAGALGQALVAIQAGGVGGALAGGGAILGGLSGIQGLGGLGPFGLVASALGGVFSLFDNSEDRRHRQLMEETRRIRQNTEARGEPRNISLTLLLNGREVSAAVVEDLIYEVGRMERRDATPRLPPR